MATETFAYAYLLNARDRVRFGDEPGHADNPFTNITINTGSDPTLDSGDTFTFTAIRTGTASFDYASGDGLVATFNGRTFWLTNTPQTGWTRAVDDGPSFVVCFLAGTMVATPTGEAAIETLNVGDLVLTADGTARPVHWLARQTVSTLFADPARVMPVWIRAGALGEALPARDLFVSPDHALHIDGLLVQAGALVNGTSITRSTAMPRTFVYYHVELEDHSLILAEGVPAETFIDNVSRRAFDNWAEAPEAAVGTPASVELDLPRVKSARQLPSATVDRLAARAAALDLAVEKVA